MWRRTYLLLLVIRVYFALSPSYLHPDENFQGPELFAGVFNNPMIAWQIVIMPRLHKRVEIFVAIFPKARKKKRDPAVPRLPYTKGENNIDQITKMQVAYSHFLQSYHGSLPLSIPSAAYSHYGRPTSFQWASWNGSILKSGRAVPHPTWSTMRCAVECSYWVLCWRTGRSMS